MSLPLKAIQKTNKCHKSLYRRRAWPSIRGRAVWSLLLNDLRYICKG